MPHVGEDSFHGLSGQMGASWFHDEAFKGIEVCRKAGLLKRTKLRPANMHDGQQAKELLEHAVSNSGQDLDRILGDTAYGDSESREDLASLVAKIIVKIPRQKTHQGCPGANALRREDVGSSVAGYSTRPLQPSRDAWSRPDLITRGLQ